MQYSIVPHNADTIQTTVAFSNCLCASLKHVVSSLVCLWREIVYATAY